MPDAPRNPFLTNKYYDNLKFFALVLLPALGAAYFGLGGVWDLPKVTEVVGTITVVDTFLGVVLGLSSSTYKKSDAPYDGTMNVVQKTDGSMTYDLSLNGDPAALANQRAVSFKVARPVDTKTLE